MPVDSDYYLDQEGTYPPEEEEENNNTNRGYEDEWFAQPEGEEEEDW